MRAERIEPVVAVTLDERHEANALLTAARPLLALACRLRLRRTQEELEPLRERLRAMVDTFDAALDRIGADDAVRKAVRYCLCTFVDEIVAATPSGGSGAWASRSLLLFFHGETSGGERFFSCLRELSRDASAHLDALELIYVMLALGMEGRYRLMEDGPSQLESVRRDLRRLIVAERGTPPGWPGAAENISRGRRRWNARGALVVGSLSAFALLAVVLQARLHAQARPVIETLAGIRVAAAPLTAPPIPAASALPTLLARRLADDLAAGRIALEGTSDRAVLTLGSDGMFASGSAVVMASRVPLLRRVGAALRALDARILVVGHTDDEPPSRGKRSNWQLSLARATQVVKLLREDAGEPERFLAQGRGASEPVAPNDSPAGKARNRRVVITIVDGPGSL
jgi:type VI secretion system protein ImpK